MYGITLGRIQFQGIDDRFFLAIFGQGIMKNNLFFTIWNRYQIPLDPALVWKLLNQ